VRYYSFLVCDVVVVVDDDCRVVKSILNESQEKHPRKTSNMCEHTEKNIRNSGRDMLIVNMVNSLYCDRANDRSRDQGQRKHSIIPFRSTNTYTQKEVAIRVSIHHITPT